ncbi:MAG: magnetochrome domain-containing protein [Magnetococcales bacterium]|nr:magnetochrome domain-containing protein [Magnetococcales bacterium]NGZ28474.1 magnetochrome domain-containing protein [Magnetococcales bacterium]
MKLRMVGGLLLVGVIAVGLIGQERLSETGTKMSAWWNGFGTMDRPDPQLLGEIFGSMPKPTQPALSDPIIQSLTPQTTRKVVVKRIPTIDPGSRLAHTYWGECTRCHLLRGGPPPGSQPITPVGKFWEKASTIKKVGPPILPDSNRPHPPSGRCIKCHDIVIEVPI